MIAEWKKVKSSQSLCLLNAVAKFTAALVNEGCNGLSVLFLSSKQNADIVLQKE